MQEINKEKAKEKLKQLIKEFLESEKYWETKPEEDDTVIEENGVKLLIDSYSQDHLKGANVDYIESLMGSGFKINNPNVKKSCSCGSSFSTE